ncbi:hypothetical protein PIB30_058823 [Stylosanthes scabra]|uniref:Ribonuclease H1 N-terminal domain-containing protein n=1 Tax=Stylosanthes scabra TaxID=79078 RepID=A0ABU6SK33_9FABA|nr:hypothetical protein [Stylosanthes scabra]
MVRWEVIKSPRLQNLSERKKALVTVIPKKKVHGPFPIPMEGGKYTHYAVRVGRILGIYEMWEEAEQQVKRFSMAQFKGFKSLDEAVAYMQKGADQKLKGPVQNTGVQLTPQMQRLGVGSSSNFRQSVYRAETTHSTKLVAQTRTMSRQRKMGCPMFEPKVFYSQVGEKLFAFTAELRCQEKGLNLEVEGFACPDERRAREDVTYNLLDNLLRHTSNSILDFNYRRLCVAQQRGEKLEQSQVGVFMGRVHDLEGQCEALRKQIEVYQIPRFAD